MSAPDRLSLWREIILGLFPWLARIGLSPSQALQIQSPVSRTELEGGGPAVLRVPDVAALVFDPGVPMTVAPALYLSLDGGVTFTRVAQVTGGSTMGGTVPPPTLTPTTPLAPTGSTKVTCG